MFTRSTPITRLLTLPCLMCALLACGDDGGSGSGSTTSNAASNVVCQAAPTCDAGEDGSQQACGADEADCREVSICEQTLYCRPEGTVTCGAVPTCSGSDEVGSQDPCGATESMCSEVTVCEQTLYCRPATSSCEAVPACNPEEEGSQQACGDGEEGCREVTVCGETLYCRVGVTCEAVPACEDGELGSEDACEANEGGCREVTVCGETLYCRGAPDCEAVPVCTADEEGTEAPCGADEDNCRAVSECGLTLYCRGVTDCAAVPTCAAGEEGTEDACGANEGGCRAVTVCGDTLYCRVSAACQDPSEPNNTPGAAAELGMGCRTMGSVCAGDEDWFQIEVSSGEEFKVSARFFNSQGDLDLTLYADQNDDGVIEATERVDRSWNSADCEAVSNEGAATWTTYWLKVDAPEESVTQDEYRLSWGVGCGVDEPQEPFCE